MNKIFQFVVFALGAVTAVLLVFSLHLFSSDDEVILSTQNQQPHQVIVASSSVIETGSSTKKSDEKINSLIETPATTSTTTTPNKKNTNTIVVQKTGSSTSKVVVATPLVRDVISDTMTPSALGDINQSDVWNLTNAERVKMGLRPLSYSKKLNAIAQEKANDMLTRQYFEHESPTGVGIKELSENFGYAYLSIGENLALGDFASSSAVVDGWMNSPGHRANILKKDFSEIGISAIQGNYHGDEVWFVVQEFGRPLSECPLPDDLLKQKIIIFNGQLNSLETTLNNLEVEIAKPIDDITVHNSYVHDYNTIVTLYNNILSTTKTDIQSYNREIESYNTCVAEE